MLEGICREEGIEIGIGIAVGSEEELTVKLVVWL